jgi:hypothetical protein
VSDQSAVGSGDPEPGRRILGSAPASVWSAARLMYVRAGVGIVGMLALLATKDILQGQIQDRHPSLSGTQLVAAANAAVIAGLVTNCFFVVLYALLALQVRRGERWARTVTIVLAALGALGALASSPRPAPLPTRILSLLGAALDVGIIVFLTRRPSVEYFRQAL